MCAFKKVNKRIGKTLKRSLGTTLKKEKRKGELQEKARRRLLKGMIHQKKVNIMKEGKLL